MNEISRKTRIVTVFILFFLLSIFQALIQTSRDFESTNAINAIDGLIGKSQQGFYIDGNAVLATISSSGNGTEQDPYILEDLIINEGIGIHWGDCFSSGHVYGIYIENTDKFFIIRNWSIHLPFHPPEYDWWCMCEIHYMYYTGIALNNVTNGDFNNNTITFEATYLKTGFSLYNSINNTISTNTIIDNGCGISLIYSNSNKIINNTLNDNYVGITLSASSDNLLINNTINNNYFGLRLQSNSNYNFISNNTFIYNMKWIDEDDSCIGNTFENNLIQERPPIFTISWLLPTLIGLGIMILIVFKKRRYE